MMKTARSELMFNKLKERNGLMKSILEKLRKDSGGLSLRVTLRETLLTSSNPEVLECPIRDAVAAHVGFNHNLHYDIHSLC